MHYFITDDLGYVCSAVFTSLESALDYARSLFERDSFGDTSVFRIHRFDGKVFFPCVSNLFRDGYIIYGDDCEFEVSEFNKFNK